MVSSDVTRDVRASSEHDRQPQQRSRINSVWLAGFGILLLACYGHTLWITGKLLAFNEDMAHGFFAPIVAAFIAWERRQALLSSVSPPSRSGIVLLVVAALMAMWATLANSPTFSRFAFLVSLAGCVLVIGGAHAFRRFRFPILLLVFTFPVPPVLYGELTLPMQLLASRLSEGTLEFLGYSVIREGNILELAHHRVSVVEACSGMRSLVSLSFFCLVYAYFLEPRPWLRVFVVLSAIPSAIFLNVIRITATSILGEVSSDLTEGVYHDMLGWSVFVVGFFLVVLTHRLIRLAFGRLRRRD